MREEKIDFSGFSWLNEPEEIAMSGESLEFVTKPGTDFWQRTHYGYRHNTGHAFLTHLWEDFSFSVRAEFFYETMYDQCGLLLYLDEDNWAKCGIEFMDEAVSLIGSVVTNQGYSDWACTPCSTDITRLYLRINRRGRDFRFDCSQDGDSYSLMRIFHMHGDLSVAKVGIFAGSPSQSSFKVRFDEMAAGASMWQEQV